MKPLHLNLAARPYRDYRPYIAVMAIGWLLVAAMALNNVETWYRYQRDTKVTRNDIAVLEQKIETERRAQQAAEQRLHSIDVKTPAEQAKYVNSRLAERAFSWSELLDRMEHVLPDDVRLESISPSFNKDGLVHLSLQCSGKNSSSMVSTIDRLNHDSHFASPFPNSEDNTGQGYRFGLGVDYRPSIARAVE